MGCRKRAVLKQETRKPSDCRKGIKEDKPPSLQPSSTSMTSPSVHGFFGVAKVYLAIKIRMSMRRSGKENVPLTRSIWRNKQGDDRSELDPNEARMMDAQRVQRHLAARLDAKLDVRHPPVRGPEVQSKEWKR